MEVIGLPALRDNYIWLVKQGQQVVIVDPGESHSVLHYLEVNQLEPIGIFITHGHDDHIAGVTAILEKYPSLFVKAPIEVVHLATQVVKESDQFELWGNTVEIIKTAGHTSEHISFIVDKKLFCGDALFSAGCGRVFTKDYAEQFAALQKISQLEDAIEVYAGHEYTVTNLRFANEQEPMNQAIATALAQAQQLRAENQPTLPTTIGKERAINLFLQATTVEAFKQLRDLRDKF
ncbi:MULTISPECIES: hydroxyacylglutathione hydrolase [unclassified Facklamia]|uniref:hydroxyacylglutathione hydrolase n=1 Tax=Aerococcaceae TaxID=186827 RepID=UPI0013BD245C|nr:MULTISPECIES: hydroxyacylglutathione hydrolase [unclassified Facklamia]NEW64344.1 hydroxyacylglutathione hydrolase [Facklamia sp. 252]NEW67819.1 hydroxyacylglutathione hydrolase [Facklamia sp. 253]QQD64806.1 hydroxyacylglutathione hydrolase [Aerococcaceae bacterium zg-252]